MGLTSQCQSLLDVVQYLLGWRQQFRYVCGRIFHDDELEVVFNALFGTAFEGRTETLM